MQRPWRAHRVHARGCVPLLPGHRDRGTHGGVLPWQPSHALVGSVPQGEERRSRGLLHTTCSSRASRDRPPRRVASWAFVAAAGGTQHREEVAGARAPAGPAWADGSTAGDTPAARAVKTTRLSGSRPSLGWW